MTKKANTGEVATLMTQNSSPQNTQYFTNEKTHIQSFFIQEQSSTHTTHKTGQYVTYYPAERAQLPIK